MPHNFKEGKFLFQYPQGTLSSLFSKSLVFKMEHCHHFSSYLSLPTLLRENPSNSLTTFSSSIVSGDFYKGLFDLVLSGTNHPASPYFVGLCAASATCSQNPACGSSLGQGDQL